MAKKTSSRKQGISIDKKAATETLDEVFREIEARFRHDGQTLLAENDELNESLNILFTSDTQAYREALVGVCLARLADLRINLRLPYVKQAENAFSGRSLDEAVVNPFFKRHRIPSSTGPYLSAIRRNAKFLPEQEERGLRHIDAFRGLLACLEHLEQLTASEAIKQFLGIVLNRFLVLRQKSDVVLVRVQRFSVTQLYTLIESLLQSASGGRWPVLLAGAMFRAVSGRFDLGWEVQCQGINVADAPSGAAGDITVKAGEKIVLAAEVTERRVDRTRVITTFNAKIADAEIYDYIFFAAPDDTSGAKAQAEQYFAQGRDINFVDLAEWLHQMLVTIGVDGRQKFVTEVLAALEAPSTPGALKVTWNSVVTGVVSGH
ncbi:MAG: restriction endonuclease, SacI family [Pirellulaceae bacterium]